MIYLSGCVRDTVLNMPNLGVMLTPQMGNRPNLAASHWAADTGCFTQPEKYDTFRYLAWLDGWREHWPTCLFATAPDVVGDGAATLDLATPILPLIRHRVPAALVAQNGMENLPLLWDAFDALFIGGTTAWKLSEAAWLLVAEAKARGKWVHQGRVNSKRRLVAAALHGCDSADGTFLAFGPDTNWPRVQEWMKHLEMNTPLPWGDEAVTA